jgi:hypothetical protein
MQIYQTVATVLEGTMVATMMMLFFALCGAWIMAYQKISEAASKSLVASSYFWWHWICW